MRRAVKLPTVEAVPEGRMVDLPGRGSTFVVDVPGPIADAPTIVLLHALGCTAYLTWFGVLGELSRTHRVVALDLRWHGRGIRSPRFRIADCADDVAGVLDELGIDTAIVAGYSLGGAVAQEVWHRHPERVSGLVLASTARNLRGHMGERMFFPVMTLAMHPLSRVALTKVERVAAVAARDAVGRPHRPDRLGPLGVPQHLGLVDAGGARRARPLQLRALDRLGRRADRGRRHRPRQGDPDAPPAPAGRGDPRCARSTTPRAATPRSCSTTSAGCRSSSRRSRT